MAKTFFSFDTSLNNGDLLSDHRIEEYDDSRNEEEYDARNDETFGGDLPSSDDDWEQQHEQFAEIEENTKLSEEIENSLSQLVLDDLDSFTAKCGDSIWSIKNKNGDDYDSPLLSSLRQKVSDSLMDGFSSNKQKPNILGDTSLPPPPLPPTRKICTVEELERNLLKNKQQQKLLQQPFPAVPHQPYHHIFPSHLPNRPPPGLHPMQPAHLTHMPSQMQMRMMYPPPPGHFIPQGGGRPFPSGLIHPNNGHFPINHPFNFPPRNMMINNNQMSLRNFGQQHQLQHQQQHQRVRHDSGGYRQRNSFPVADQNKDEYAGLMTNREKQWLLNIQLLQLNTGTPYFDDYYYTMYKERKINKKSINQNIERIQRRNNNQDNQNLLQPRVYTPLQFENSLGKLQCGSVTAPRKIIDMDIVTPEKDPENASAPRDTRKSKQILLELEAMYSLFLKAIDLKHPLALYDMEKLREMKQKQRLKELEAAQTAEQKHEVLALLREESRPQEEDQNDYFFRILKGLLQEEKFNSFFNFNKGKTLIIRLLPYLTSDLFSTQLKELWLKILLSLPVVGRKDTIGDNILPRFYPYFKNHIENYQLTEIIDLTTNLTEIIKQDNVRSTPISIRGKQRLHFILSNKFGISAVAALIIQFEKLSRNSQFSSDGLKKWIEFLVNTADVLAAQKDIPTPKERIGKSVLQQHLKRFDALSAENKITLENAFSH